MVEQIELGQKFWVVFSVILSGATEERSRRTGNNILDGTNKIEQVHLAVRAPNAKSEP